jgi:hypothetical protein
MVSAERIVESYTAHNDVLLKDLCTSMTYRRGFIHILNLVNLCLKPNSCKYNFVAVSGHNLSVYSVYVTNQFVSSVLVE